MAYAVSLFAVQMYGGVVGRCSTDSPEKTESL